MMENNAVYTANNRGDSGPVGALGTSGKADQIERELVDIFNKISKECGFYSSSGQSMPGHLRALLDAIGAYTKYRDEGGYIGAPGGEEKPAAENNLPDLDEKLLECYSRGFKDELGGLNPSAVYLGVFKTAYRLGRSHAIIGDEVRRVDYLSESDILEMIKKEFAPVLFWVK